MAKKAAAPQHGYALVAGTFDTKGPELLYLRDVLQTRGLPVLTVDLATAGDTSPADVKPEQVASAHPEGTAAIFCGDRGGAVTAMADAFANWISARADVLGIISAGGSGGTALATAGMRRLAVGIPKIMVSTVASGQVGAYVGASDIMMMYAVADVQGLNRITRSVLGNAAHALAGMISWRHSLDRAEQRIVSKPAIGITMFGVTTPCVQAVIRALEAYYDCLVFHATGTGGRSMEKLADSGFLAAMLDLTTTEVADMLVGGVFPADQDRFGAAIRTRIPTVISAGAVDMVNFGPRATVPPKFEGRNFVIHNPQVTLMRTTADENRAMGEWIGHRINLMHGPVRVLLPEGGVSLIDVPGKPFHDPEADAVFFAAIEETVVQTPGRRVERVAAAINDEVFVAAILAAFRELMAGVETPL
jgi:uncharacterized protein (UPF0261 family)